MKYISAITFISVLTVALQLFGAACLSLGIYVLVDKNQILVLTRSVDTDSLDVPSLLESAAYALIAGGGFVFLVAFLGCCGAMKRDKCMLTVVKLFTCVIVITLLHVELSVVMYLLRTNEFIFRSYRTRLVCTCNQRTVTLKATMALHYHGVIYKSIYAFYLSIIKTRRQQNYIFILNV